MAVVPFIEAIERATFQILAEYRQNHVLYKSSETFFPIAVTAETFLLLSAAHSYCVAMLWVASVFVRDQRLRRRSSDKDHFFGFSMVRCGRWDVLELRNNPFDAHTFSARIQISFSAGAWRSIAFGVWISDVCS